MAKFADRLPAGTVTVAGTVAAELFDARVTVVAAATLPAKVTVPVRDPPPRIVLSESVTETGTGGSIVSRTVCVMPNAVAVT
jgi:hypothetical protein